jgi:hypothetical protein
MCNAAVEKHQGRALRTRPRRPRRLLEQVHQAPHHEQSRSQKAKESCGAGNGLVPATAAEIVSHSD